jgi:hypothetical protein
MKVQVDQKVWFIEKIPLCIYPPALRPEPNMAGAYRLERREAIVQRVCKAGVVDLMIEFPALPGREEMVVAREAVPHGEGPNCWVEWDA